MDRKLIVEITRVRHAGQMIPRYQHALGKQPRGILTLNERQVPWLNRHSRIAELIDQQTGELVEGVNPLLDATMIHAAADEWTLTGFERLTLPLKALDCAQTWIVRAVALDENVESNN